MKNKKQKTRRFGFGDRVRVIGRHAGIWLQKDNRVGTVKGKTGYPDPLYFIEMDKPVKRDKWVRPAGIVVRRGYCYCAWPGELLE